MKTKLLYVLAWVLVPLLVIYIESSYLLLGTFINLIVPCKQELMTSAPCYAVYDAVLMIIMSGVIISVVPISVLRFLRHRTVK